MANQQVGDGPLDLLKIRLVFIVIDFMREESRLLRFLDRLSSFSRHS